MIQDLILYYKKWRDIYCNTCLSKKEMTSYDKRICRTCNPKNRTAKAEATR